MSAYDIVPCGRELKECSIWIEPREHTVYTYCILIVWSVEKWTILLERIVSAGTGENQSLESHHWMEVSRSEERLQPQAGHERKQSNRMKRHISSLNQWDEAQPSRTGTNTHPLSLFQCREWTAWYLNPKFSEPQKVPKPSRSRPQTRAKVMEYK